MNYLTTKDFDTRQPKVLIPYHPRDFDTLLTKGFDTLLTKGFATL